MTQKPATLDIWDILLPLVKRKRLFLIISLLGIAYGLHYAFSLSNLYQSTASIYPLQTSAPSMGGMEQALGGLAGITGLNLNSGSGTTKLLIFLKSKTLAERVLLRIPNEIYSAFYPKIWDSQNKKWLVPEKSVPYESDVIKNVSQLIKFVVDDDNILIEMRSETADPYFSKQIVETYISELRTYLADNDLTVAQKNKTFLRGQLLKSETRLLEGSRLLGKYNEIFNVKSQNPLITVTLDEEAEPSIDDPEYSSKLSDFKSQASNQDPSKGKKVVIKNIPADAYYYFLNAKKELQHMLNKSLERDYQAAVIAAEKEKLEFTVVDKPEIPIRRSRPNRIFIVGVAGLVSVFLAFVSVHIVEGIHSNYRAWIARYESFFNTQNHNDYVQK